MFSLNEVNVYLCASDFAWDVWRKSKHTCPPSCVFYYFFPGLWSSRNVLIMMPLVCNYKHLRATYMKNCLMEFEPMGISRLLWKRGPSTSKAGPLLRCPCCCLHIPLRPWVLNSKVNICCWCMEPKQASEARGERITTLICPSPFKSIDIKMHPEHLKTLTLEN